MSRFRLLYLLSPGEGLALDQTKDEGWRGTGLDYSDCLCTEVVEGPRSE